MRAFPTTIRSENPIATTHMTGLRNPSMSTDTRRSMFRFHPALWEFFDAPPASLANGVPRATRLDQGGRDRFVRSTRTVLARHAVDPPRLGESSRIGLEDRVRLHSWVHYEVESEARQFPSRTTRQKKDSHR